MSRQELSQHLRDQAERKVKARETRGNIRVILVCVALLTVFHFLGAQ